MIEMENDARFANILDECCERVRRGEALESCLADYPTEYHEELRRLVPVAGRVSRLTREPSTEFVSRLEARLLSRTDEAERIPREGILTRFGRFISSSSFSRVVVTAAAVILVLAGSGIGVDRASAGSLPDSPLYNVKAAKEQVQLALARAPESQVDVRAAQLSERNDELDRAVEARKQPKVVETVASRVETSVEKMVDQALAARGKGNLAPTRRAFVAIRLAERRLENVIQRAQPNVRPSLQELRNFLGRQEQRLTAGDVGSPFPTTSRP